MHIENFGKTLRATLLGNIDALRKGARRQELLIPIAWGEAGIGKTDMMRTVVASLGNTGWDLFQDEGATEETTWTYADVDLSTRDSADLGGSPWVKDGRSVRMRPDWLPEKPMVIVALDEMAQADTPSLNIIGSLLNEGRIGEHKTPNSCFPVAASNPAGSRMGTNILPGQIRSRIVNLTIDPDARLWSHWAALRGINPLLVAYARARPTMHHKYDKNAEAYPCARAWTMVNAALKLELDPELIEETIAGCVGTTAATDFVAFKNAAERMPDLDDILQNPFSADLPHELDITFVTMQGLATRANATNLDTIVQYLERLSEREFATLCLVDATNRDPALTTHPAYGRWQAANGNATQTLLNAA